MLLLFLSSCSDPSKDRFQGYVEGEFVYVASPLAGQLETLSVQRGQQVTIGQPLFALDETPEKAAREQIEAALVLSEAELARQEKLFRTGVAATQDLDRARSTRDQDKRRLTQTDWSFEQKKQAAPQSGLVFDTLFRQGEWVPAGKPVGRASAAAKYQSARVCAGNARRVYPLRGHCASDRGRRKRSFRSEK